MRQMNLISVGVFILSLAIGITLFDTPAAVSASESTLIIAQSASNAPPAAQDLPLRANIFDAIGNAISSGVNALLGAGQWVAKTATGIAGGVINSVANFVGGVAQGLGQGVHDAFNGIGSVLNMGKNFIEGVVGGIGQVLGLGERHQGQAPVSDGDVTPTGHINPIPPSADCLKLFDLNNNGVIDQSEYDKIAKRRGQHSLNNAQNALVDGGACKAGMGAMPPADPKTGLPGITGSVDPVTNLAVPSAAECAGLIKPYDKNNDGKLDENEILALSSQWVNDTNTDADKKYTKILACRDGGMGATPPAGGGSPKDNGPVATLPGGQGPPKHVDVPGLDIKPNIFNDINGDNKFTLDDCALLHADLANKGVALTDLQYDFTGDGVVGGDDVKACEEYFDKPAAPPVASIAVTIACTPSSAAGLKPGDPISCTANAQPAAGHAIASYAWRANFPPNTGADQTFKFSVPGNQTTGLLTVIVTGDDGATGTSAPMIFAFPAATQPTPPPSGGTAPLHVEISPPAGAITPGVIVTFSAKVDPAAAKITSYQWSSGGFAPDANTNDYSLTIPKDSAGKIVVITLKVTDATGQSATAAHEFGIRPNAASDNGLTRYALWVTPKDAVVKIGETLTFSGVIVSSDGSQVSSADWTAAAWTTDFVNHSADPSGPTFTVTPAADEVGLSKNIALTVTYRNTSYANGATVRVSPATLEQSPPVQFIVKVTGPATIQAGGTGYTYTAAITTADGQPVDPTRLQFKWTSPFTPPSFSGSSYTVSVDPLFYLSNSSQSYKVKVQATDNAGGTGAGESDPIKVRAL